LKEQGLSPANGRRADGSAFVFSVLSLRFKVNDVQGLMAAQRDFQEQEGRLQQEHEAADQEVIFYPKFHCELNFIEHFWCLCKAYTRDHCTFTMQELRKILPKAIKSVSTTVKYRLTRGWYTYTEWAPGHTKIPSNERADILASDAASQRRKGRTSIAWLKEQISQYYTIAKDTETDKGKKTILPPTLNNSFLDRAPNQLAGAIAQIRTGHWLSTPYLKRVRKNREELISDLCWWCGRFGMSRTHVFLRCSYPSWRALGLKSGTAQRKMVAKANDQQL
jgi:hypothetical protein